MVVNHLVQMIPSMRTIDIEKAAFKAAFNFFTVKSNVSKTVSNYIHN